VPALFARGFFPELLALDGATGARQIILAHRNQAVGVPFADGSVDVDTPADYARISNLPTPIPA
jgi:molybdenum cofactor cytidylyltransferase